MFFFLALTGKGCRRWHHINRRLQFVQISVSNLGDFHLCTFRLFTSLTFYFPTWKAKDFDPDSVRNSLPKAVSLLEWAASENRGKVYVHCTAGLGRAPAVAIAYLFWFCNMDVSPQLSSALPNLLSVHAKRRKKKEDDSYYFRLVWTKNAAQQGVWPAHIEEAVRPQQGGHQRRHVRSGQGRSMEGALREPSRCRLPRHRRLGEKADPRARARASRGLRAGQLSRLFIRGAAWPSPRPTPVYSS